MPIFLHGKESLSFYRLALCSALSPEPNQFLASFSNSLMPISSAQSCPAEVLKAYLEQEAYGQWQEQEDQ